MAGLTVDIRIYCEKRHVGVLFKDDFQSRTQEICSFSRPIFFILKKIIIFQDILAINFTSLDVHINTHTFIEIYILLQLKINLCEQGFITVIESKSQKGTKYRVMVSQFQAPQFCLLQSILLSLIQSKNVLIFTSPIKGQIIFSIFSSQSQPYRIKILMSSCIMEVNAYFILIAAKMIVDPFAHYLLINQTISKLLFLSRNTRVKSSSLSIEVFCQAEPIFMLLFAT